MYHRLWTDGGGGGGHNMDVKGSTSLYEVLANLEESGLLLQAGGGQKSRPTGKPHPIRKDKTNDPNAIAEVGWDMKQENMISTAIDAKKFIKWYHINKVFQEHHWKFHHKEGLALTCSYKDPHFKHRLLEMT